MDLVPPEITSEVTTVSTELNSDAVLTCEAEGDPDPQISWYRDGTQLDSDETDERYEGKPIGSLIELNRLVYPEIYDCSDGRKLIGHQQCQPR